MKQYMCYTRSAMNISVPDLRFPNIQIKYYIVWYKNHFSVRINFCFDNKKFFLILKTHFCIVCKHVQIYSVCLYFRWGQILHRVTAWTKSTSTSFLPDGIRIVHTMGWHTELVVDTLCFGILDWKIMIMSNWMQY